TITNGVTNYLITIKLDTESPEIFPNMAATTNIIIETKSDVLLVPSAVIQTQSGQSYVRILRNRAEVQIPVEVGISGDTQTEITSGLSEGDEVITGTITNSSSQRNGSVFGTGTGGGAGAFRPGGFGGGGRR
ncbi:MAG: hypothetical protein Q7S38_01955, partial [bacterium]|nr:hypothetical protein [bacterium]